MFVMNWITALITDVVVVALYIYIAKTCPGNFFVNPEHIQFMDAEFHSLITMLTGFCRIHLVPAKQVDGNFFNFYSLFPLCKMQLEKQTGVHK